MNDLSTGRRRIGWADDKQAGEQPLMMHDAPEPREDLITADQNDPQAIARQAETDEPETYQGPRQLVRVDGHRGHSLSESLVGYFYRLTWRTPLHKLRLKGRSPLRLLAAPVDPFTGDPRRGKAIRAGHFLFAGHKQPIAGLDYAQIKAPDPFIDYLHSFAWLRDLAAAGAREQCAPTAEALLSHWLASHIEKVSDPAWRADLAGARLINCAAHAPLILSNSDMVYRSRVLRNFVNTARHLDHVADRAPEGLPRLTAWAGVVTAALLLPDGDARRVYGEAGLNRALGQFFSDDGGALSRSPDGQIEAIRLLAMLRAVYAARNIELPTMIADALASAVPALQGLTHHDGSLSSWQGALPISGEAMASLIAASGVRGRPIRQARHWGYQRIPAGRSVVIVDAGTPAIARHAMHGCASTLAFEMSHGAHRLIVNCGGAGADESLPEELVRGLRATAAHSTLCLDNTNSTAVLPKGRLGKGVGEVEVDRRDLTDATRLDMSHDGYVQRYGLLHRRLLLLRSDGSELRGEDILEPRGRRGKLDSVDYAIRFHLGPDVEAHLTSDSKGALLRLPDGPLWQFRSTTGLVALEESLWMDSQGRAQPTQQIVLSGTVGRGGSSFGWLLKMMG